MVEERKEKEKAITMVVPKCRYRAKGLSGSRGDSRHAYSRLYSKYVEKLSAERCLACLRVV